MRAWRYFKVKILPITRKCVFCPLPRALRPCEPCPCPFLNTRPELLPKILEKKKVKSLEMAGPRP